MRKFHEKVGDADMGSGSFHKGHNKKTDDNDIDDADDPEIKLCTESASE